MAFSDQELSGMGREGLIAVIKGLEARLEGAEKQKKLDYADWAKKHDQLTEKLAAAVGPVPTPTPTDRPPSGETEGANT